MARLGVRVFVALLTLCAGALAEAQQSKVVLTTDKPVYKLGDSSPVKITLTNQGTAAVNMGITACSVLKGDQFVASPIPTFGMLFSLASGQSQTWTWNKKTLLGILVSAGSYTISVGPLWIGNSTFTLTLTVAVTPSGHVAGTSRFPIAVVNEWTYRAVPSGATNKMQVLPPTSGASQWYLITNLAGEDRWCRLSAAPFPTLWTIVPSPVVDQMRPLFRFNRPLGYSYQAMVDSLWKLKVAATSQTVVTPAGKFTSCYRLNVEAPPNSLLGFGFKSFVFARGIGLVEYSTWGGSGGGKTFRLVRAKVMGSDGVTYTLGKP